MRKHSHKLKVAILGTGNIGTDLLIKTMRSAHLECSLFAGRNLSSAGMVKANHLGIRISDRGVDAIAEDPECCELVFDATSAIAHERHWPLLDRLGKVVIDMTPAKIGMMCVPAINLQECLSYRNINMVTCGGQASIPIAHAIARSQPDVEYLEVVSSISSRSAGPATRLNLDEYILTTEMALRDFTNAKRTKAILVLNPAQPPIDMQTTIFAKIQNPDIEKLRVEIGRTVRKIQSYVPGYQLVVPPVVENDRLVVMVRVQGLGDYLPRYAGNLDIINSAAIATAEEFARSRIETASKASL